MPPVSTPSQAEKFTPEQVCRMLGISTRQLRRWQSQGLVSSEEQFGFPELVALKTIIKLQGAKVRADRIRKALAALRAKLGAEGDPLTDVKIFAESGRITVSVDGSKMEPVSGQLLLDFDEQELNKLRSFPAGSQEAENRRSEQARRQQAREWFERGVELERRGAVFQEIVDAYQKALELDEKSVVSLVNLGTVWFREGKWKNAESYFKRALLQDPDYALAHFNLANVYDELGDLGRAAKHYGAAIRLDQNYADAHYNLALNCQTRGQTLMAVRHWRAYLKLDQGSEWATIARRELEKLNRETIIHRRGTTGKFGNFSVPR